MLALCAAVRSMALAGVGVLQMSHLMPSSVMSSINSASGMPASSHSARRLMSSLQQVHSRRNRCHMQPAHQTVYIILRSLCSQPHAMHALTKQLMQGPPTHRRRLFVFRPAPGGGSRKTSTCRSSYLLSIACAWAAAASAWCRSSPSPPARIHTCTRRARQHAAAAMTGAHFHKQLSAVSQHAAR
jgi:hypothetical protein